MRCRIFSRLTQRPSETHFDFDVPNSSSLCSGISFESGLIVAEDSTILYSTTERSHSEAVEPNFATTGGLGWDHALTVSSANRLWGIGWNSCGQILPGAQDYLLSWTILSLPVIQTVVKVAAGEKHSLLLTEAGAVWAWGCNADGQLGTDADTQTHQPMCVLGPGSLRQSVTGRQLACGARHSCVVTEGGEVWCWGWSLHGQCASPLPILAAPTAVQGLKGLTVTGVAAGLAHTLALTEDGDLYSWGWNEDGQLGLGDFSHRISPELVEDIGCDPTLGKKVSCGARHSVVLTTRGVALGCGCTKHGELGPVSEPEKLARFTALPEVQPGEVADAACGWWHTALLLHDSQTAAQNADCQNDH